ncbi:MAG: metallophosphoesterase [Bacteroidia bacterium]|nr:metallophosphoesterase [Bacteroidia bacterium]MCF8427167.1 metallophosphoesterase [Bacteroidia bacterium]MCF8445812.1 metallophosphoesterase [Bacteroidia bacterium]
MRSFVISDIHGNNELFRKALKQVNYKKSDKLFILGDLIDRGSDSKGVLDTIFLLLENGFNIECILGNHEQMLIDSIENPKKLNQWLINGGDKTLSSFLTGSIERIPSKYFDLIRTFRYYIEYNNYILVHASLNMKIENPFSDLQTMIWERNQKLNYNGEWLKNRRLIHGHNPQEMEQIINSIKCKDSVIGIDNGTFLKKENYGSLCILQLENLEVNFIK